jgi:hypothetical protein
MDFPVGKLLSVRYSGPITGNPDRTGEWSTVRMGDGPTGTSKGYPSSRLRGSGLASPPAPNEAQVRDLAVENGSLTT